MGLLQYLLGSLPSPDVVAPLVAGIALAGISFVWRRPLVTLPEGARRRRLLVAMGVGGSLVVVATSVVANALTASIGPLDATGYSGWWMRPLALGAAGIVLAVAAAALATEHAPAPGERALLPRRSWLAFASGPALVAVLAVAALLAATIAWQIRIAVDAPEDGAFYGRTGVHVDLPVWMPFTTGQGYVAGVGWPNHLATGVALAAVLALLWALLRGDAARPVPASEPAATTRSTRVATARVLTLVALGGVLATFGAVWAFVGFTGQIVVGVGDDLQPDVFLGTGYAMLARPMQAAGLAAQALAVAVLMRLAIDTTRAAVARRAVPVETSA
ncbi:hypothetical protein [Agrococcus jejuensis]|uniref:Uncharacterized protein n=1 Tax=Agrococcus jejuensis TaxID=399736 RepID=A0A1G8EVC6_9MICO|nr:hypothetical protein [Agrococcus jejuensis]SDH73863.1 hypothetical protein SAMN04489720_2206 [Agrococcus jejuensis]